MESEAVRRLVMALEDAGLAPQVLTDDSVMICVPGTGLHEVIAKPVETIYLTEEEDTEIEFNRPSERMLGTWPDGNV